VLVPGTLTIGQNAPDKLTSERHRPVIKIEVAHVALLLNAQKKLARCTPVPSVEIIIAFRSTVHFVYDIQKWNIIQ
jgi:hypothetical protein